MAFGLTLWITLTQQEMNFIEASLRAVGAGIAILLVSLLLSGLITKLGESNGEENHMTDDQQRF